MKEQVKIGIIICDRYKSCAGGKCFRSIKEKAGAFDIYQDKDVELVGYTSCGGCPGGNIEYAPEELKKNGAEVIHFATGMSRSTRRGSTGCVACAARPATTTPSR